MGRWIYCDSMNVNFPIFDWRNDEKIIVWIKGLLFFDSSVDKGGLPIVICREKKKWHIFFSMCANGHGLIYLSIYNLLVCL